MNSENVTECQSHVAERHHLGRHSTFHFVLNWAKKRTHTQIMSCRILSIQVWSSSVDVHVLWKETKIEKKSV